MDVAHAMHPNHTEKCDIKNQDLFRRWRKRSKWLPPSPIPQTHPLYQRWEAICKDSHIPYKKFSNRSDLKVVLPWALYLPALLSMKTVDVGVPILAMHSARELMGAADQASLEALASKFFLV